MGISRLRFLGVAIATLLVLTACGSSPGTTKVIKVGLVTDTGGLNDKSFNHLADVGLEKAKTEFHVQGDVARVAQRRRLHPKPDPLRLIEL